MFLHLIGAQESLCLAQLDVRHVTRPFLLLKRVWPARLRPDIEVGLCTGIMSRETKAAFLFSIAEAMFSYKMYPKREEYSRIVYQIVAQYPFLKSSKGSCSVCFMYMYMYLVMLHLFLIHAVLCQAVTDESFQGTSRKEHQVVEKAAK